MLYCQLTTVPDPRNPTDKSNVCLRVKTSGVYDFRSMAADISQATSLTEADVLAAMRSFVLFTRRALLAGRNVELEDLGLFRLGVSSRMIPSTEARAKHFRIQSMLRKVRVCFLPATSLKAYLTDNVQVRPRP